MTPLLVYTLVIHVLSGTLAIGLVCLIFMHLLKKSPSFEYLQMLSGWSIILFLISWASSAYYYVTYYGAKVKPVIVAGKYPWAHQIFLESKEHVFILLPFLAIVLWLTIKVLGKVQDERLKSACQILAFVTLALGVFITAAGMITSGAVR